MPTAHTRRTATDTDAEREILPASQRRRRTVAAVLFEVRCPGRGRLGWCPCEACISSLVPPQPAVVEGAASVALLFSHEGVGREFIHALKYRRERAIARWLGESVALAHRTLIDPAPDHIDTVTWAPTTAAHRRARGFDQAEVVARAVARALRIRRVRLLDRVGTTPQTGASRVDRLVGPDFAARPAAAGRHIVLVDDVLTTGATLRVATAALLEAGAAAVHVAACARRGNEGWVDQPDSDA